ncbi:hypothetical protein [Novipirellula aureliae]|nr:hypothetical protein [Novipirellula aureliae]
MKRNANDGSVIHNWKKALENDGTLNAKKANWSQDGPMLSIQPPAKLLNQYDTVVKVNF